jgi:transcription elongation factor
MNSKDIRTSTDSDLAGSYAAIMRAAKSAEDVAIKTNTGIIVSIDGKDVCLTTEDIKKLHEKESLPQGS